MIDSEAGTHDMIAGADARHSMQTISAVIATYRDAPAIPIMHQRLVKTFISLGVNYEIIFVDDASPDDGRAVMDELARADPHVSAVHLSRDFGSQSAFSAGLRLATGDAVVLLDGDLQDPPELVADFVARWREGFDVVYGIRTKREAPLVLQAAYKGFYRLFRRYSYVDVPVDAGDFSLMDRRVVDAVNSLPESNRFVRGLRAWVGFRQTGVSYTRPERMFGRSSNSWLRNLGWARKALVSFSYAPLDLITLLAAISVIGSLIGILVEIVIRIVRPDLVPSGLTTVIVLILFLGGVQLTCLSIIGSYLAHIYDEVKRRPPYIIEDVVKKIVEDRGSDE